MNIKKAIEYIRCAEINLDNLVAQVPIISPHPFYSIVKKQMKSALEELEGGEA